jgi:hypothetical protein
MHGKADPVPCTMVEIFISVEGNVKSYVSVGEG